MAQTVIAHTGPHTRSRLGCNAGKDVSRCYTRGESEESIAHRQGSMQVREAPRTGVQNRGISGSTQRTDVLQNLRKVVYWKLPVVETYAGSCFRRVWLQGAPTKICKFLCSKMFDSNVKRVSNNEHPFLLHGIVHNNIFQDKYITICQQYFLQHNNSVLSLYKFGLDSWKPWLVASGMDIARSVENV